MNDLITYSQLLPYFDNESFVIKTQQQIAKDFAKFDLKFDENFAYDPLTKEGIESLISERVADLMKHSETRLLQLLYTIDLPEKEFLELTTQPDFLLELSRKILLREAYKVFLRSRFS
ncbi:MAG: hypothetical protein ACK45H_13895 [Bacteroidota bacterium]